MRLVQIMDKIELQKLIDGELNRSEQQQLLCQLDEQKTEWRSVALALLEEQEFRRAIGSQCNVNSVLKPNTSEVQLVPGSSSKHWKQWLPMALAASLLVGVGSIGGNWLASRFEKSQQVISESPPTSIAVAQAEDKASPSSESSYAALKPVGQLSFSTDGTSGTGAAPMQLPIYEAAPDQINQMLQMQQLQMQALNEQLRLRGFQLEWRPEMLESQLPDGRAVIVPVQQVNVRSLGQ